MAQKIYIVEGRQFRTEADYNRAMHDKEIAEKIRERIKGFSVGQLALLKADIEAGKFRFQTLIGDDILDEIEEEIKKKEAATATQKAKKSAKKPPVAGATDSIKEKRNIDTAEMDSFVKEELARQEKRRKRMILICGILAVACLGYFGIYTYYDQKTKNTYEELAALKEKPVTEQTVQQGTQEPVKVTLDGEKEAPEVLEKYKNLLNTNKKLIGWVKIDDTNIDYPVMQTTDNDYYLNHNLNQEYDKNGSIFMDKDCDVLKPSTNFILYGHHMKNGSMFGNLHLYGNESYYEEHPYIEFDTIYEEGTYQVMYVFRSKVYSEEEIVFKYYQFIDAYSEQEFNSYMQEMAALSYYDTGVTAKYGDQLLTLSTCDYQEKDGRFVVVAKKIE